MKELNFSLSFGLLHVELWKMYRWKHRHFVILHTYYANCLLILIITFLYFQADARSQMMTNMRGIIVYILICYLSTIAASTPTTPSPHHTTVLDSAAHNDTTASIQANPLQQQQARKSARNFQPSIPTSTSTYPYDTAKRKLSYSPPDYHLSPIASNFYSGNHAFVYNTYSDKGKQSMYLPPAAPATDNNMQGKASAKYSSVTGASAGNLPTTAKIDRSQDDREGLMQDYFTQNSGSSVPLVSPNSRHGYGHYDEHGDYGTFGDDDDYDGGHHYSPDLYSHHHHGHHHHHPTHHYPPPAIYYPAHSYHDKHEEYSKLGILAIVKIVLAKLKALGLVKIILILLAKIPLIFLKIAIKFFFLFKAVKLFKLLTFSALFPLILIPLIPLLLLPLLFLPLAPLALIPLLLPLILPFLLMMPVPVMNNTPPDMLHNKNKKTASSRRRRDAVKQVDPDTGRVWRQLDASHDFLALTQRVLESQQCLERLSCKMAAKHDSTTYTKVILW